MEWLESISSCWKVIFHVELTSNIPSTFPPQPIPGHSAPVMHYRCTSSQMIYRTSWMTRSWGHTYVLIICALGFLSRLFVAELVHEAAADYRTISLLLLLFFWASGVPIESTSNSLQHACSPASAIARCIIRMDITGRDPLFDDDEEDPELQNQSVHPWTHSNEFRVSLNAALHFLLWVCQVWVAWSKLEKHNNRTKSNSFMEVMGVNAGIRGQ